MDNICYSGKWQFAMQNGLSAVQVQRQHFPGNNPVLKFCVEVWNPQNFASHKILWILCTSSHKFVCTAIHPFCICRSIILRCDTVGYFIPWFVHMCRKHRQAAKLEAVKTAKQNWNS